jgi:hypothetical protein
MWFNNPKYHNMNTKSWRLRPYVPSRLNGIIQNSMPWRWRQYTPPKRQYSSTRSKCVITLKIIARNILPPWRWRLYDLVKSWHPPTRQHEAVTLRSKYGFSELWNSDISSYPTNVLKCHAFPYFHRLSSAVNWISTRHFWDLFTVTRQ